MPHFGPCIWYKSVFHGRSGESTRLVQTGRTKTGHRSSLTSMNAPSNRLGFSSKKRATRSGTGLGPLLCSWRGGHFRLRSVGVRSMLAIRGKCVCSLRSDPGAVCVWYSNSEQVQVVESALDSCMACVKQRSDTRASDEVAKLGRDTIGAIRSGRPGVPLNSKIQRSLVSLPAALDVHEAWCKVVNVYRELRHFGTGLISGPERNPVTRGEDDPSALGPRSTRGFLKRPGRLSS
jgi:hypothetical protein